MVAAAFPSPIDIEGKNAISMTIRAITFDFWLTLFRDLNGEKRHDLRMAALREAIPISEEEADKTLREVMDHFMRQHIETQNTLTPMDAVQMACAKHQTSLSSSEAAKMAAAFADAILLHPPEPIEDALEAVTAAAEKVPVAIISDTGISPGKNLSILLERQGFLPLFQSLAFSDEIGAAKPQRIMFETTAQRLGVRIDELLHIGDLEPTDIVGAQQVNSKAALFTAVNDRFAEGTKADYIFPSWRHFLELLPDLI